MTPFVPNRHSRAAGAALMAAAVLWWWLMPAGEGDELRWGHTDDGGMMAWWDTFYPGVAGASLPVFLVGARWLRCGHRGDTPPPSIGGAQQARTTVALLAWAVVGTVVLDRSGYTVAVRWLTTFTWPELWHERLWFAAVLASAGWLLLPISARVARAMRSTRRHDSAFSPPEEEPGS